MLKDCMRFPDRETVERVRAQYPPGTKVKLVRMEDGHAPQIGTTGVVKAVDDTASLIVAWSDGSGLNVIFGVDEVRIIQETP